MVNKWLYGSSWEKYPIENIEFIEKVTDSVVSVCDITQYLPNYMKEADLIYCDPPWLSSNLNSFYTKAGYRNNQNFEFFASRFFECIHSMNTKICFIEIGKQNLELFRTSLKVIYDCVQIFEITYYKKNPCFLLRGSSSPTITRYDGMDDMNTPLTVMQNEQFTCVADLCAGRGLTGITAYKLGKRFVGTELNKRRLAVMIDIINNKLGGFYEEKKNIS